MSEVLPPESREGQTFAHRGSRWLVYVNFVKLPHTLFALPFALVGVVLASYHAPVTRSMIGWIVVAFTCAVRGYGIQLMTARSTRKPATPLG